MSKFIGVIKTQLGRIGQLNKKGKCILIISVIVVILFIGIGSYAIISNDNSKAEPVLSEKQLAEKEEIDKAEENKNKLIESFAKLETGEISAEDMQSRLDEVKMSGSYYEAYLNDYQTKLDDYNTKRAEEKKAAEELAEKTKAEEEAKAKEEEQKQEQQASTTTNTQTTTNKKPSTSNNTSTGSAGTNSGSTGSTTGTVRPAGYDAELTQQAVSIYQAKFGSLDTNTFNEHVSDSIGVAKSVSLGGSIPQWLIDGWKDTTGVICKYITTRVGQYTTTPDNLTQGVIQSKAQVYDENDQAGAMYFRVDNDGNGNCTVYCYMIIISVRGMN